MPYLKISEVAKLFMLPVSTVRYYEKQGLCSFSREQNNYRMADVGTIRNLCDVSFYRQLSCSIEQIRQLPRMSPQQISQLLLDSRENIQQQLQQLTEILGYLDEKLERIRQADTLRTLPPAVVMEQMPAFREFSILRSTDVSNLIRLERNLFIIIPPGSPASYCYGIATEASQGEPCSALLHQADPTPRPYFKFLLQTDYQDIEKNNLAACYKQIEALGFSPGATFGKVLVSANEGQLHNYYEAWIELLQPSCPR